MVAPPEKVVGREVFEGGGRGGGGLKGGGFGRTLPPPMVPLWSLPKAGRKFLRLKSSWHKSKILAASLKHYKRRREGRRGSKGREVGGGSGEVPPLLLRCTAVLIHHWWWVYQSDSLSLCAKLVTPWDAPAPPQQQGVQQGHLA